MPGLPTVLLEVENSAGFMVDVTRSLRRSAGYSITRGKADRFGSVEASKLDFVVRNDNNKFTPITGTLGLRLDRRVRLTHSVGSATVTTGLTADPTHAGYYLPAGLTADTAHSGYYLPTGLTPDPAHAGYYLPTVTTTGPATTSRRFNGYISAAPTSWNGARGSYLRITAYDKRPVMARHELRQAIEEEALAAAPVRLYPLTEPPGAAQATSIVGSPAALVPATGGTGAPVFGVATGIGGEGATSCVLTYPGRPLVAASSTPLSFPNGFTVAAVITTSSFYVNTVLLLGAEDPSQVFYRLEISAIDGVRWIKNYDRIAGGGNYGSCRSNGGTATADGNPHLLVATSTGSSMKLFVDGVLVDTATETAKAGGLADRLTVGPAATDGTYSTVTVGQVALFDRVLSGATITRLAQVAASSPAESSDARVSRLARYAGFAASDIITETGAVTTLVPQPTQGRKLTDLLAEVDAAEGGLTALNGAGQVVFQNRRHRATRLSAAVTLAADDLGDDPQVAYDWEGVENTATGSRVGNTTATFTAQNNASVAAHDLYPADDDLAGLLVTTDTEVQDIVSWRANRYPEPAPRLPDVTFDLLTATTALQQSVLGVELSDRLALSSTPLNAPTVGDLVVEGWTETVTDDEWSWALNASAWAPEQMWILDDPVYGVVDSTTRVGY